jgi:hypothetical protein
MRGTDDVDCDGRRAAAGAVDRTPAGLDLSVAFQSLTTTADAHHFRSSDLGKAWNGPMLVGTTSSAHCFLVPDSAA